MEPRFGTRSEAAFQRAMDEWRSERDAQAEQIRSAWAAINEEKARVAQMRRDVEAERAQLNRVRGNNAAPSSSGAPLPAALRPFVREAHGEGEAAPSSRWSPVRSPLASDTAATQRPRPVIRSPVASSPFISHAANQSSGDGFNGPFWIVAWLGTSRYSQPARVLMPRCSHLRDLIAAAASEVGCSPPPNILYTPDGRTVTDLSEVQPFRDYLLIPHGNLYREECVPTMLLEKIITVSSTSMHVGTSKGTQS